MFTGLSAFPLTPLADDAVDEHAFVRLIERLSEAKVDSITALGSTGSYAYLSGEERSRVAPASPSESRSIRRTKACSSTASSARGVGGRRSSR